MTPGLGDFFVTTDGPSQAGLRGSLFANAIQWITDSPFNHAGVFVGPVEGVGDAVVEARPGGVGYAPLARYSGPNTQWSTGRLPPGLTPTVEQRQGIAGSAVSRLGVPYLWLDIAAIALAQKRAGEWNILHAETPLADQPWWVRRLVRSDRLICSQLVDWAYLQAGVHCFADGRPEGMVSPGDLGRLML